MIGTEQAKSESAVLLVNACFYRAFSEGDAKAMADLWAKRAPVACLHPGAPLLIGRDAVLKSWRQILKGRPSFNLRCDSAVVHLLDNAALVFCYEGADSEPAHLAATNVFVLEDDTWRMTHHHAGPLSKPVAEPPLTSFVN